MSMAASRLRSEVGPVVVMGVSGSGKSLVGGTLAARLDVPFIEGDQLHPAANVAKMSAGTPLTDDDRWPWLDRVGEELRATTATAGGAIAACSALKRIYRDWLRQVVSRELRFVFLRGDRATLAARMVARAHHFMPASLLDSQLATLEDPSGEKGVLTIDVEATPAAIVAEAVAWLTKRDV
jgi:gluconokinase